MLSASYRIWKRLCIFDSIFFYWSAPEDGVSYFGFSFWPYPFVRSIKSVWKSGLRSYLDHLDYLAICGWMRAMRNRRHIVQKQIWRECSENHSCKWKRESEGNMTRKEHIMERQRGAKQREPSSEKAITERISPLGPFPCEYSSFCEHHHNLGLGCTNHSTVQDIRCIYWDS